MTSANLGPAVVLLSGLPGAGKTTFARQLATLSPIVHIESDAIRRAIFPAPRYVAAEHHVVFREAEQRARRVLDAGQVAVIDATNLLRSERRRFSRLGTRLGAAFVAVRVVAPEATIRQRLAAPRDGHSQAELRVFELMRARPQPFDGPLIVVDTRYPLGPSLRLLLRLLEQCQS